MSDPRQIQEDVQSALAKDNPYYPYILFYIPSLNRFMDHEWMVVHDLSPIFNAWELERWKRSRRDDILFTKDGVQMMIYYLNEEENEDVLEYLGWNDSYGVKVDRDFYRRGVYAGYEK